MCRQTSRIKCDLFPAIYTCVLTWEDLCTSDDRFDAILLKWRSLFVLHIYGLVIKSRCLTYRRRTSTMLCHSFIVVFHCTAHIEKRVVITMLSITHVLRSGVRHCDKMVCVDSCDHQSRVVCIILISQRTSFSTCLVLQRCVWIHGCCVPVCRWGVAVLSSQGSISVSTIAWNAVL